MDKRPFIGIDFGGTRIKGAVVEAAGRVLAFEAIDTEGKLGFRAVFARLVGLIERLPSLAKLRKRQIGAIGIGVPGPMSRARGFIFDAPNLPGWKDVPLRKLLRAATGLSVVVENDANAAGFGEFTAGAARAARNMVFLTLGTGIGGGVVLDGKLWAGAFDNAGEIGHTIAVIGGRKCGCGQRGCLERYASASAIAHGYRAALRAAGRTAAPTGDPIDKAIDAKYVSERVAAGERIAMRVWQEACTHLAAACVNVQHMFNPELIVLGGGLIESGQALLAPVRREFQRLTWTLAPDKPRITLATLGGRAGVIGAAALARV